MKHLARFTKKALLVSVLLAIPWSPAFTKSTITVALIGEADTFDPMISTKDIVSQVTQHFVETLYTFDSSWNVAPLLAVDLPELFTMAQIWTQVMLLPR